MTPVDAASYTEEQKRQKLERKKGGHMKKSGFAKTVVAEQASTGMFVLKKISGFWFLYQLWRV